MERAQTLQNLENEKELPPKKEVKPEVAVDRQIYKVVHSGDRFMTTFKMLHLERMHRIGVKWARDYESKSSDIVVYHNSELIQKFEG